MKNFQRNLFVVLAIGLCGLCAWQWYWQAAQLNSIEGKNLVIEQRGTDIQGYTNSIRRMDDEISQLHDHIAQLKQTAASNDLLMVNEKREVARLQSAGDLVRNQLAQYQAAMQDLTNKLSEAFDGEKKLAAQRDEFVKKLTDSIQSQNDLTVKYNDLVGRFNKLQTNNAAQK
jgi:chromosome segregation ATPase